jgi:hypothetical protein
MQRNLSIVTVQREPKAPNNALQRIDSAMSRLLLRLTPAGAGQVLPVAKLSLVIPYRKQSVNDEDAAF